MCPKADERERLCHVAVPDFLASKSASCLHRYHSKNGPSTYIIEATSFVQMHC